MARATVRRKRQAVKDRQRNFKLSKESSRALESLAKRFSWTATTAVERALLFSNTHPEFRGIKTNGA